MQLTAVRMIYFKQVDKCNSQSSVIISHTAYIEALEEENERVLFEMKRAQQTHPDLAAIKTNAATDVKKQIEKAAVKVAELLLEEKQRVL